MLGYQLAFDFDGTTFNTAAPSPHKMNVAKAYDLAVRDIFGHEGTIIYNAMGGLSNRAPSEVVSDLLTEDYRLAAAAEQFLSQSGDTYKSLVSQSLPAQELLSEILVQQKLHYLMREIGKTWPLPMPGFTELWQTVQELKSQGIPVDTSIISSGHAPFIRKVFNTWELKQPDILVTEDDVRARHYPSEVSRKVKPARLPIALARNRWLQKEGILNDKGFPGNPDQAQRLTEAKSSLERTIYFGDDPRKDGLLAENVSIPFGLIKPGEQFSLHPTENKFVFGNFKDVSGILKNNIIALAEGKSFNEIFFDRKPRTIEGQYHYGKER